jgi:hypothetical protein
MQTLDPKDFREQYEASFETAGGLLYYAFDRDYNVRPCTYRADQPILVGSDFNVDPMAWVLMHRYANPTRYEIFDELWIRDTNTVKTLSRLHTKYAQHKGGFAFYGDPSGRSRQTSASQSDYETIMGDERFKMLGRTVHYPLAHPNPSDRFAAVNAMLCNAAGERRMFIAPNCKHLIADLEAMYYKPGTTDAAEGKDLKHITDALGYAVHYLDPIRAISGRPSGRFGVIAHG